MTDPVAAALSRWRLDGATTALVATRENRVYRVDCAAGCFALRFHRRGYRTNAELRSELQWMAAVAAGGMTVPSPVAAADGHDLQVIDGEQASLLTWLPGAPMGAMGHPLRHGPDLFFRLGADMARLHAICDAWSPPSAFRRWSWNADGLVGAAPLWGRFWDNPTLRAPERAILVRLRDAARQDLAARAPHLDAGLIHADLVRENVLVTDDNRLTFIDFDDGGFGFRLFDIATTLHPNRNAANFAALRAALLDGYQSLRRLDLVAFDLMMALRAATYVGWIITRMDEDGAEVRNRRYIDTAVDLAETYLRAR